MSRTILTQGTSINNVQLQAGHTSMTWISISQELYSRIFVPTAY